MSSTSSAFLDPQNHHESVRQILDADIVLAIDSRAKIEFVLFGRDRYYQPQGSGSGPTLTILRISVNGRSDIELACRLVQEAKGQHEFHEDGILSSRRQAMKSI